MWEPKPRVEDLLDEWHRAIGDVRQKRVPLRLQLLRQKLIKEEHKEVQAELKWAIVDRAALAKELADLVYVAYGTAWTYEIPLEDVIAEVHRSNMTKLSPEIEKSNTGKILKGEFYEEPDIQRILDEASSP